MKTLLLAAAVLFVAAAGPSRCTPTPTPPTSPPPTPPTLTPTPTIAPTLTPTPTPPPPPACVALESIANGASSPPLADAVEELSVYLADSGRPCADSYREYADNIRQASPPLTPEEVLYYAGQLAWACRADVPEGGCTTATYANPPVDPGGHSVDLLDANGPHLNPIPEAMAELKELRGWRVLPEGTPAPGAPECYSAGNPTRPVNAMRTPDWAMVPTVDATTVAMGVMPAIPSNAVPANPRNPYRLEAPDGLYGWKVLPSASSCYFVKISRPGLVRYSPAIGVLPDQPVNDLNQCWESNKWYSDILTPCP